MNIKKYRSEMTFVLISLAAGGIGGWITMVGLPYYLLTAKPPLTPPPLIFPIAWTILYILMGIGMGRVWKAGRRDRNAAAWLFAAQLAANVIWTFIFFGMRLYLLSFFWLVLLWVLIYRMTLTFKEADGSAAKMQAPYLIWTAFAGYLNLGIWLLNR